MCKPVVFRHDAAAERRPVRGSIDLQRPGAYFANGDHCQFIYVDPALDLVIVRHGTGCGEIDWVELMGEIADWVEPRLADAT